MKKIFAILAFISIAGYIFSQIPYYGAIKMNQDLIRKSGSSFQFIGDSSIALAAVLKAYLPDQDTSLREGQVLTKFRNNPFMGKEISQLLTSMGASTERTGLFSNASAALGGIDVTNFADGLAKFLVARAKEELNVAFFRKFQDFLKGYPEVQAIFPATYDIVSRIYSYQYAAFLPALRSSFHQDMNSFSTNMISLRELEEKDCTGDAACASRIAAIHTFLNDNPIGRTFVGGLIVSDNVIKGNNAVEILDLLANDEVCSGSDNFSNSIRFLNFISASLRSTEEGALWVNKNQISKLIGDPIALKLYLGLLYASAKLLPEPIQFTSSTGALQLTVLLDSMSRQINKLNSFRNNLRNFGYVAANVSAETKNMQLEGDANSEVTLMRYADYASSLAALLRQGVSFFNADNTQLAKDVSLFTAVVDDAVASCYDIKSKNYTSLLLHTSSILDTIFRDQYTFKNDYIKYGNFMANIIEANNSDEVKAAIEAAVLPVGSSSIKRETFSNISLNAYIGPMAGMEYLPGLHGDQTAPVIGVSAPLGISFNWGNIGNGKRNDSLTKVELQKKSKKGGKSLTLFVPLIDVGAIATYRISDDSSHVASEVKLENIVAPGLYGYYGFGKVPISIGLGAQIGPQLRKINAEDVNVDKNFYIRYGLNIVVDIPFFNFYTRN